MQPLSEILPGLMVIQITIQAVGCHYTRTINGFNMTPMKTIKWKLLFMCSVTINIHNKNILVNQRNLFYESFYM